MTNDEILSLSAVHLPFFSKTNQDCIVAFAEAIRKDALLEAAEWFDDGNGRLTRDIVVLDLRRMAEERK